MQALLSIITPTYNMKSSLPKTIESVDELKRRYNKIQIEYVIIDGSSTDGTVEVIKKYHALGIVDEYISEKDNGVYDAMNKGLKIASGEYVLIIGADDYLLVENFGEVFEHLIKDKPDICYGNMLMVSKDHNRVIRKYIAGPFKPYKPKFGWHPPHQSTIVRKKLLIDIGGFNQTYKIGADIEANWKILLGTRKVIYINKYLSIATIGGISNRNMKNVMKGNLEIFKIAKSLHFPFPLLTVTGKVFWKFFHALDARLRPMNLDELNRSTEHFRR